MTDFQKAVAALRSAGFEVKVGYKGFVQVATIQGEEFFGTLNDVRHLKKVMRDAERKR